MKMGLLFAAAVLASSSTVSLAEADVANGEKVFKKCIACHSVGADAKNKVGPILNGVVGAVVAHRDDFKYSNVLLEMKEEGVTWTEENLTEWLHDPKGFAKGTKMVFAGLKKDEDIADVIAYMATFE
jgi:cytochrome c